MLYPSDLTNSQWQVIKPFVDSSKKCKHRLRHICNALFYIAKSGCQWRMLPLQYPPWQTVYYYFQKWQHSGALDKMQQALVRRLRKKQGKKAQPSAAIIDAQSVKSTLVSSRATTGFDGGKKIKGIKRHIVVDTLGLLLCVVVHAAGIADRKGGALLVHKLRQYWQGVQLLFADGGYSLVGRTSQTLQSLAGYVLHIVKRTDVNHFKVLPKRWIVERTFAWLDTYRRNAKSYERLPATTEAMTKLAAIRLMLYRIKKAL